MRHMSMEKHLPHEESRADPGARGVLRQPNSIAVRSASHSCMSSCIPSPSLECMRWFPHKRPPWFAGGRQFCPRWVCGCCICTYLPAPQVPFGYLSDPLVTWVPSYGPGAVDGAHPVVPSFMHHHSKQWSSNKLALCYETNHCVPLAGFALKSIHIVSVTTVIA